MQGGPGRSGQWALLIQDPEHNGMGDTACRGCLGWEEEIALHLCFTLWSSTAGVWEGVGGKPLWVRFLVVLVTRRMQRAEEEVTSSSARKGNVERAQSPAPPVSGLLPMFQVQQAQFTRWLTP